MYLGTYSVDIESDRMLVISAINMGFTIFNYITANYFISSKIKTPTTGMAAFEFLWAVGLVYVALLVHFKPENVLADPIFAVGMAVVIFLVNISEFHSQLKILTQDGSLRHLKQELLQIRAISSVEKIKKFVSEDERPGLEISVKLSDSENKDDLEKEISDIVKNKGIHCLKIKISEQEMFLDLSSQLDFDQAELG